MTQLCEEETHPVNHSLGHFREVFARWAGKGRRDKPEDSNFGHYFASERESERRIRAQQEKEEEEEKWQSFDSEDVRLSLL